MCLQNLKLLPFSGGQTVTRTPYEEVMGVPTKGTQGPRSSRTGEEQTPQKTRTESSENPRKSKRIQATSHDGETTEPIPVTDEVSPPRTRVQPVLGLLSGVTNSNRSVGSMVQGLSVPTHVEGRDP